jgi:hypothetical protein
MQDALAAVLNKRKDRALALILGVKEREVDQYLPVEAQRRLRKVVLDALNDYHEMVVDVMGSLDSGEVVLNQDYLDKIDAIHDKLVRIPLRAERTG